MAARLRVRCKPSKLEIQISRFRSFAGEACVQTKGEFDRPSRRPLPEIGAVGT